MELLRLPGGGHITGEEELYTEMVWEIYRRAPSIPLNLLTYMP
jgi:hypothetical protein